MKKTTAALSLIFAIALSHASARIGETLNQCAARYGSSTGRIGPDQIKFIRGHVIIIVHVLGDRSVREDFAPEAGSSFSESEIAELLQENAEGSAWEVSGEGPTYLTLSRKDGQATAQKAKPNQQGSGNIKLTVTGAELIIRYNARAAHQIPK